MSDSSRRFGRFTVSLTSTCTFLEQSYSIQTQNLSIGGCFFSFENTTLDGVQSLQIDDRVQLSIPLQNPNHTIEVEARIAWIDSDFGCGCSFERLKPLDVWSLIQFTREPEQAFNFSDSSSIDHQID